MIIQTAQAQSVMGDAPSVLELILRVLQFLLTISSVLALVAIVFAGILYMVAGGDTSRVALAKKALLGSVIGLGVILLSLVIVTTIIGIVGG